MDKSATLSGFRGFIFSPLFIYICRSLIGFSIGYVLMKTIPQYDLFWALISVLLVISPEAKDSWKLSIDRVKANFIGALSGFAVVFFPIDTYLKVMMGIILGAVICKTFNLLNVVRTTIVAMIIILIEKPDEGFIAPIERFISVLLGCLIGLLVVLITAYPIRYFHKKTLQIEHKLRD